MEHLETPHLSSKVAPMTHEGADDGAEERLTRDIGNIDSVHKAAELGLMSHLK